MAVAEEGAGVVAGRYRIERVIGRGAMGEVLEVFDETSGNQLALKRPHAIAEAHGAPERASIPNLKPTHSASLLRHEYLILSQLAHPNVVAVYDFGSDQGTPYYTMELLRGHHPGSGGTLPWREVCRMLITLCEPLALLHSRHLVHRDLSSRNVFVAADGSAKLIDFGAMASMGAHHRPIGTPSCMAPEVWRREQLDGRTDVYGLGALSYCALTGKHAYAARSLAELPIVWQSPPPAPSALVADVPHALDQLILSMLSLERHGRPMSVAEVMRRLLALAELNLESSWVAPPEALAVPALVGRDKQLALIEEFIGRTRKGRGQTSIISGQSGSGRTRFLDAISQSAQDAGMHVVRASAGTLEATPFALLREIAQALDLLDAERTSFPPDAEFAEALALLLGDAPLRALDDAASVALQRAFLQGCERVAAAKPLCIAIDDIERADPSSTRVLAQLARRTSAQPQLLALASTPDEGPTASGPFGALQREAVWIELPPLEAADTEALVRSAF